MNTTHPKKIIYGHLSRIAKAMASPGRLELLEALAQGPRSVDALARASGMSVANTSHHLQTLREAGLVQSRRAGMQVIYSLSNIEIPRVLSDIGRIAENQVDEVERMVQDHIHQRDGLAPIKRQDLMNQMEQGDVTVLDVRPEEEYRAGHILGAINIPVDALPRGSCNLDQNNEIVAYCRGPYCLFAVDAVTLLRETGFRARRLEEGFPEWRAAGLPVQR